jgi:CDP-diglyceride synthetase
MNPHELDTLHVLHVSSVLVLLAYTFFAFAGAPETRKRVLMITGIASLLVLLTGVRLWQGVYSFHFFAWIAIKLVCWLGLSALSGIAYRKRAHANTLMLVALALAITAVAMVYVKPFSS